MVQMIEVMSRERLDHYITEAAKAADYDQGFGVKGCDLSLRHWWSAYTRQSTREQAENDRLGEYLLTCAKLAKQNGLLVPHEHIIYDADSSEDLNRPGMIRLRAELIAGRRIAGIIIPFQGRLSADPLHQLTFEKECNHYGVQVVYGDAPSGSDWASQTTRLIQAQANALRVKCNRDTMPWRVILPAFWQAKRLRTEQPTAISTVPKRLLKLERAELKCSVLAGR